MDGRNVGNKMQINLRNSFVDRSSVDDYNKLIAENEKLHSDTRKYNHDELNHDDLILESVNDNRFKELIDGFKDQMEEEEIDELLEEEPIREEVEDEAESSRKIQETMELDEEYQRSEDSEEGNIYDEEELVETGMEPTVEEKEPQILDEIEEQVEVSAAEKSNAFDEVEAIGGWEEANKYPSLYEDAVELRQKEEKAFECTFNPKQNVRQSASELYQSLSKQAAELSETNPMRQVLEKQIEELKADMAREELNKELEAKRKKEKLLAMLEDSPIVTKPNTRVNRPSTVKQSKPTQKPSHRPSTAVDRPETQFNRVLSFDTTDDPEEKMEKERRLVQMRQRKLKENAQRRQKSANRVNNSVLEKKTENTTFISEKCCFNKILLHRPQFDKDTDRNETRRSDANSSEQREKQPGQPKNKGDSDRIQQKVKQAGDKQGNPVCLSCRRAK